jgi:Predicted hydrolase of the metallo-beta-lactamase superfamily
MSVVQVIPLGGVGEIGKNCTVIRQGDDMVVIDCGLSFPTEEMLGVDIVIPDFTYLLENKDKIRGLFLTHAHEDHVGALPYLLPEIPGCPIYASQFTHALIRNKLEERIGTKGLILKDYKAGEIIQCGSLSVEPIESPTRSQSPTAWPSAPSTASSSSLATSNSTSLPSMASRPK